MFHKENSSTSSRKGKKAKDVPLRKSDRRALRQRVAQVLTTTTMMMMEDAANKDDANANNNNNNNANDDDALHVLQRRLLDEIFLQGTLVSRQIQLPDHTNIKATLYIRSPSSSKEEEEEDNIIADNNNITSSTGSHQHYHHCHYHHWPFTVSAQCVWIQLDSKSQWQSATDGTAILVDVPTLPLLAVLSLLSLQLQKGQGQQQKQQQQQQAAAVLLPTITVPHQVSKYLCRGAHLMRAGMREWLMPSSSYHDYSSSSFRSSNRKEQQQQQQQHGPTIVAVQVQGNPQPFAVGILADDLDWKKKKKKGDDAASIHNKMIGVGTTGVGVTIVTCYGDDLWRQQKHVSTTTRRRIMMAAAKKANNDSDTIHSAALFDDGDYGNAGFCQGKYVVPISDTGDNEDDSTSEDGENVQNNQDQQVQPAETKEENINHAATGEVNAVVSAADETSTPPPALVEDDDDALPTQDSEKEITIDATPSEQQQQQDVDQSLSPEQVLHAAVCRALVQINPKKQLPMLISTFYSQHVLPNRLPNTTIELKRTRYKKLGPYLAEQIEAGLMTVKADTKTNNPMAILTDYNKRHPDLQEYTAQEKAAASTSSSSCLTGSEQRLVITNLYCLPAHFASLLRLDRAVVKAENATSPERKGTGMLTAKEMRSILEGYIDREGLVDSLQPQMVVLDGPLTDALYGKKKKKKKTDPQKEAATATIPERLSRKDLVELWTDKMEGAYAIVQLPGNHIVKMGRGKAPSVTIEVAARQSRKFATYVRGLEHFGLDAAAVCKDVSQRFACSGSVEEHPVKRAALPSGHVELVFQGNLADELEALLMGDESLSSHGGVRRSPYRLPKKSIEFVLRKGVPARKKSALTKRRK